ncbi:MAG TPA: DUF4412 domain-containing protein [Chitinophagaceae bacterium]|nr:DUF4412 domain-containing protein [Chitinophagaceae bacterium]
MKKVFIFTTFVIFTLHSQAQRGYVRRAVRDNIEEKQEEKHQGERDKGEKAVDERLDTWDANDKKVRAGIQPFPTMSMTMELDYPEKPKNNGSISYYYKDYDCAAVMKFEKSKQSSDRIIMNFKLGKTTMLMTDKHGRKTGLVMELRTMDWAVKSAYKKEIKAIESGEATIKETNEYKVIEGYKCRKYIYDNERYTSEMWVTKDAKLNQAQLNKAWNSAFMHSADPNQSVYAKVGMHGVLIQTHMMPKENRMDECIMTFKDIRTGSVPAEMFSTAGYDVEEMPTMRNMWDSYKQEK